MREQLRFSEEEVCLKTNIQGLALIPNINSKRRIIPKNNHFRLKC